MNCLLAEYGSIDSFIHLPPSTPSGLGLLRVNVVCNSTGMSFTVGMW